MRTKTVIRYYCDHCSKGGFKKPNMIQHEANCTKNPHRGCATCEDAGAGRDYANLVKELHARPDVKDVSEYSDFKVSEYLMVHEESTIKWLDEQCSGCPTCMLAVLQQAKVNAFDLFDYKKWLGDWHAEKTRELRDMVLGINP